MRAYLKAIVSALVSGIIAFLSSLLTALQGTDASFATITDGQWVTAILAFFIGLGVGGGVTYRVPNRATRAARAAKPADAAMGDPA